MIEVKNLHKSFEDIKILKGISTSFEKGKTNLIIGQSGSGKTVLLKCLLGLFDYQQGSIAYDEKLFSSLTANEKRVLRSQIGMVFQGGALFDSLSIAENVMFPLKMFTKQSRSEMEERVNSALKRVDLENAHH
jgi:phospholipid/cholesterol/gamma-HCH transport system ATP-binding protein